MISTQTATDWYFLPDDGEMAQARFLALLDAPGRTYISAYGFTLEPMLARILEADRRGIPVYLLLDHIQSAGPTQSKALHRLAEQMQHGEITITSAGHNSKTPGAIWHNKAMIVETEDYGPPWCWNGTANFSGNGFSQGNICCCFRESAWALTFKTNWLDHRAWGREHHPEWNNHFPPRLER